MKPCTKAFAVLSIMAFTIAVCFAEENIYSPTGKMVDVGGHLLHLNCLGNGRPTIVLEGGAAAGFSFDWALVQPAVARTSRVCTYDRAGYAWSDPGPEPRTLRQIAYELHAALHAAHEHGPFILVGHSLGALIVREFAYLYPNESTGFVFVDGTHENSPLLLNNQVVHMRDLSRKRAIPEIQERVQGRPPAKPMRAAPDARLDPPYDQLPGEEQELRKAALQGDYQRASRSEFDYLPEEMNEIWLRRGTKVTPLDDKPLFVLSAATRTGTPPPKVSAADWRQLNDEKAEQQADLSRLSRNTKVLASKQAGHEIHVYEPHLVIRAVEEVIQAVRTGHPLR